ncbi:uncharacterized protein [Eurosta solidaginis]|uniref:uncharacterized protein n=1 Tax=Eurosta solidaginis TaxID=178769 RepID=UPI003530A696
MEINIAAAPKRKKRVLNFTAEEKRALIREVKEWPRIWDTSDPLHCNKNAVDQAWVHLSSSLGKEVIESKDAWTTLRESYCYHARASKRQKSGSSGGAALDAAILGVCRGNGILAKRFTKTKHNKFMFHQNICDEKLPTLPLDSTFSSIYYTPLTLCALETSSTNIPRNLTYTRHRHSGFCYFYVKLLKDHEKY